MTKSEILEIFEKTGALLTGHFILTSGLHSTQYFQCARVLQYPDLAEKLCRQIAQPFRDQGVNAVVAPAVGGILVAHEVARALGVRALFAEREQGKMSLRRNFVLTPGEKVLIVEDVITTGGSVREVLNLVTKLDAEVVGIACIVDRQAGIPDLPVPFHALISLQIETFPADDPRVASLGTAVKPGSRTTGKNG